MKRITLLTVLAVILSMVSHAQTTFTVGGLNYEVTKISTTKGIRSEVALTGLFKSGTYITLSVPSEVTYSGTTYNVTTVKSGALSGKSILNLKFGPGVKTLESGSCTNITNLESVTLPSTIDFGTSIVFGGCSNLKNVYLASIKVPSTLGIGFFPSNSSMNLYLPYCSTSKFYESTTWRSLFSNITSSPDAYDFADDNGGHYTIVTEGITKLGTLNCHLVSCSNPTSDNDAVFSPSCGSNAFSLCGFKVYLTGVESGAVILDSHFKGIDLSEVSTVKEIADYAINSASLESIVLNEGLEKIGAGAFYRNNITTLNIPSTVNQIATDNDGSYSFVRNCTNLASITVASGNATYEANGDMLFSKGLTMLLVCPEAWQQKPWFGSGYTRLPESMRSMAKRAFINCKNVTTVRIPYGLTTIPEAAFSGCSQLATVRIPSSVTKMESNAFNKCNLLSTVTIAAGTPPALGTNVFPTASSFIYEELADMTLYLPRTNLNVVSEYEDAGYTMFKTMEMSDMANDVESTYIGTKYIVTKEAADGAKGELALVGHAPTYYNQYKLNSWLADNSNESIYLNGNNYDVVMVAHFALKDVENIADITIPGTVKTIGRQAFENCLPVATLNVPEGVELIWDKAFINNINLVTLNLPASLKRILYGDNYKIDFVNGCTGLKDINVAEGNTVYSSSNHSLFSADKSTLMRAPEAYWTWGGIGAVQLTSTYAHKLNHIANGAFENCKQMQMVQIGYGLLTVGDDAFKGCDKITRVNLPSSVTHIGANAFGDCIALQYAGIAAPIPPTLGANAFPTVEGAKLYVSRAVPTTEAAYGAVDGFKVFGTIERSKYAYDMWDQVYNGPFSGTNYFIVDKLPAGDQNGELISVGTTLNTVKLMNTMTNFDITAISDEAFMNETSMTSGMTLPNTLKTIGKSAFEGNPIQNSRAGNSYISIDIPESVESIGDKAFFNCPNITEITLLGFPTLGKHAYAKFNPNLKIYVEWSRHAAYSSVATNWPIIDFSNIENYDKPLVSYIMNHYEDDVFSVNHAVDWAASGIDNVYKVKDYSVSSKLLKTEKVTKTAYNTGLFITGLVPDKMYKLTKVDYSTPETDNLLQGCSFGVPMLKGNGKNFYFTEGLFEKIPENVTYSPGVGRAWLVVDNDNNPDEYIIDLFRLYGDVNLDGVVDVQDVSAIINLTLSLTDEFRDTADVNGDGSVDVSDMNIVINIILGKNND